MAEAPLARGSWRAYTLIWTRWVPERFPQTSRGAALNQWALSDQPLTTGDACVRRETSAGPG
jgi:hypothetical protein